MTEQRQPRKKIGLALGGGGAKGLAHIGVIKVLEQAKIPIDFIAGTSSGAVVGGWYAATKNIEFLENIFLKIEPQHLLSKAEVQKLKSGALFKGKNFDQMLERIMGTRTFEQCAIPFCAVATDVETGREVDIKDGSIVEGVKASIALPIIFQPIRIGEQLLIDGGFCNPVPADVVRKMGADFVIAVDVASRWVNIPENLDHLATPQNMEEFIRYAFSSVEYQLSRKVLEQANIVLKPEVLSFGLLEFSRAKEIIEVGAKETKQNLGEIRSKAGYSKSEPKELKEKILEIFNGNI
jgi:NTE family protein